MDNQHLHIGVLVFEGMTSLDALGPFEVLARTPDSTCHLVWKDCTPLKGDTGLTVTPSVSFADAPPFDVLVVPGGPGQNDLMADDELLEFLRQQAKAARWVTSVCTGSLLLAAAGLLNGYRATCHWLSLDFLRMFPVEVVPDRVVIDRNRVTGGGVTSGLDFAFVLLDLLRGGEVARKTQLLLEYDPAPPFRSGHPDVADASVVEAVRALAQPMLARRRAVSLEAARRLSGARAQAAQVGSE
ncbi:MULTISPECIES: DJ-1/PfpI family protein [unclassified Variovorax]|uniref:DJ-1/PfpI family protein n=1 Tax=unclassified Variovorax TaxID=663243 RepID=UPI00076D2FBC|nr:MULTISPECIES: DJ-1/PfpI family protein [unclassified Variovorax]KWT74695.1 ThiJ/PfpI domain protein [Variovorax sp. WDL1]